MNNTTSGVSSQSSLDYSLDQILQGTKPPSQPSGFRRVLGGIVGGVGNMFAPGLGGMIGSAIGGVGMSGLTSSDPMQYLQIQQQMEMQQQYYETLSSVLKAKHDASMAAIHNIQ